MPPPFGTGSPSSTTRGLYSLLENGPEQCASTRQQTATAPTRPMPPKPRLESCRPIRPPAPRHPRGSPGQDCSAMPPVGARTDRGLAAAIGSLPPHIAVRSRQEWGWFGPRTSKQRGFAYPPAIRRPQSKSAFTAVRQGRTHCIDGDSSHQAGQEDAAKADHDRECARERLPRHDIAIADGEAGDEGEVDCLARRPPLDETDQEAEGDLDHEGPRQHRPRDVEAAADRREEASPHALGCWRA